MFLQHLTSLSLVHGFSELDGPSNKPANSLSNESIDVWRRTPVDLDFILAWGLPIAPSFYYTTAPQTNATCAATVRVVPPGRRSVCTAGVAHGNMSFQRATCLNVGCCFEPVSTAGEHPWCFIPRVPQFRKLKNNYTIGTYSKSGRIVPRDRLPCSATAHNIQLHPTIVV